MTITTGSAPASMGGAAGVHRRPMVLGDAPVGRVHKVTLLHKDGPMEGKRFGTTSRVAPSREDAERLVSEAYPDKAVLSRLAHKPVMGSEG